MADQPDRPTSEPTPPQSAVADRPAPSKPKPGLLPRWRVLLHNDDQNDIEFVVRTLIELACLRTQQALTVTMEAHRRGLSLVCTTHRERAELYREQFASKGLTVTIEPEC